MRAFLAVNFPASLRTRIWEAVSPVRDRGYPFRWVAPGLIHLTLKFLGEVDEGRIAEITGALRSAVQMRPFDLAVHGFGGFPNLRHPRVLYAACDAPPPLEIVQDGVERAMHRCGFPLEGRPFRPHLTLARSAPRVPAPAWTGLNHLVSSLRIDELTHVSSVHVMESRLHAGGPEYFVRASVPLEG